MLDNLFTLLVLVLAVGLIATVVALLMEPLTALAHLAWWATEAFGRASKALGTWNRRIAKRHYGKQVLPAVALHRLLKRLHTLSAARIQKHPRLAQEIERLYADAL